MLKRGKSGQKTPPTTEKKAEHPKMQAAVELGHLGGLKGGPARARKLASNERHQIAVDAALARWRGRRKIKK